MSANSWKTGNSFKQQYTPTNGEEACFGMKFLVGYDLRPFDVGQSRYLAMGGRGRPISCHEWEREWQSDTGGLHGVILGRGE